MTDLDPIVYMTRKSIAVLCLLYFQPIISHSSPFQVTVPFFHCTINQFDYYTLRNPFTPLPAEIPTQVTRSTPAPSSTIQPFHTLQPTQRSTMHLLPITPRILFCRHFPRVPKQSTAEELQMDGEENETLKKRKNVVILSSEDESDRESPMEEEHTAVNQQTEDKPSDTEKEEQESRIQNRLSSEQDHVSNDSTHVETENTHKETSETPAYLLFPLSHFLASNLSAKACLSRISRQGRSH